MTLRAIYEPKGLAGEYSELACTLRLTCSHGCDYCFCPAILRMPREDFHKAGPPRPGILEALDRDCQCMAEAGDKRRVLFSFIGDVYCPEEAADRTTREALLICEKWGIPFSVLTKGGWRATRDFDIMARAGGWFGSTLTYLYQATSEAFEPKAAPPSRRSIAIVEAHARGIFTWVSLEPVIQPLDALAWIHILHDDVDLWRVGKWNYSPKAKAIDWAAFAVEVLAALRETGASYVLKQDLAKCLPEGTVTEYWRDGVRP